MCPPKVQWDLPTIISKSLYSGKCQIIHWREVHKHECQQLDDNWGNSSSKVNDFRGGFSLDGGVDSQVFEYKVNQPMLELKIQVILLYAHFPLLLLLVQKWILWDPFDGEKICGQAAFS
ncbi:hypothetical protein ACH5RR_028238 [Cinchona calisaya]|uniref:Uncharacterized protein n=1 Tax=Cinchona calisaya TaxID=153742 RepID=A0ABD2YRI6_9GENT